jgi:hypothetical protein
MGSRKIMAPNALLCCDWLAKHGFDGLNTRVDAEMTPRYWGTYTFKNGTGVLKMSYGEIPLRSNPERADGSGLILTTTRTDH